MWNKIKEKIPPEDTRLLFRKEKGKEFVGKYQSSIGVIPIPHTHKGEPREVEEWIEIPE